MDLAAPDGSGGAAREWRALKSRLLSLAQRPKWESSEIFELSDGFQATIDQVLRTGSGRYNETVEWQSVLIYTGRYTMQRGTIFTGIILIAAGVLFLVFSLFPQIGEAIRIEFQWPLIIVGVGLLFLIGAVVETPGLAVPGAIVTGIGGLLYYQNVTGAWGTWSYAWALIPGFVGVGVILTQLIQGDFRRGMREGGPLLIISLIMFTIFGSFLGDGLPTKIIWPILLIVVGIWQLGKVLFRGRD
jgi:hypothetical protein